MKTYENKIQLGTIYIRHLGRILWHTLSAFGDKVKAKDSTSRFQVLGQHTDFTKDKTKHYQFTYE